MASFASGETRIVTRRVWRVLIRCAPDAWRVWRPAGIGVDSKWTCVRRAGFGQCAARDHFRRGGRAVECTGLENRQGFTPHVGSNPTLSAIILYKSIS